MAKTVKVADLEIGQQIKVNKTTAFVQSIQSDRVIVSKQAYSPYVFGIAMFSPNFDDLMNRVELAN